ncbi:MAG: SDR family oxidoreductase [Balneolaceae bacterium]
MTQPIAVITGANSGIGYVTAKALYGQGFHVVMVCRNRDKAEAARDRFTDENGKERADIVICDMADMQQITAAAATIRERYSRLDRLVNNAGFLPDGNRTLSADGLELTFAVNHLGYFLLTRELVPLLKATPKSRVVNVASDAHRYGEYDPDNLQMETGYSAMKAYGNSKLYNMMFTHHLHKVLEDDPVTTYSLHPGVVNSNFAADSDSLFGKLFNLIRWFMISPEKGAETTIYLCTEPGIETHSGRYFVKKKPVKPSVKAADDDDACRELWHISEELVQKAAHPITAKKDSHLI